MKKVIALAVSSSRLNKMSSALETVLPNGLYTTITKDIVEEIEKDIQLGSKNQYLLITGKSITSISDKNIENGEQLIHWAKKVHPNLTAILISCLTPHEKSSDFSYIYVNTPSDSPDDIALLEHANLFISSTIKTT